MAGPAAGARAAARRHADLPATVCRLQSTVGNRAVTALLTGCVARQPKGATSPAARFNDYADLFNDFQELAAAALNRGGKGLESYRLGPSLSVAHRNLLEDVRKVLIDGRASSPVESRQSAAADWRKVSAKLRVGLEEARKLRISGAVIAAVTDDIAMLGEKYLHARVKGPSEVESSEDYADALIAVRDLLNVFEKAPEASLGVQREEVQGRPDAVVHSGQHDENTKQRAELRAVKLGDHLLERHRALLEKLRQAMILARSETPGAAYKALSLWNSIKSEFQHMTARAPAFVSGDVGDLARGLDNFGGLLAKHYEMVHTETLATALKAPPKPGEAEAGRMLAQVGTTGAIARWNESRMLDQFRYVLGVIEFGLMPMPGRPGEWLLTSGPVQMRIRDDQAAHLRAVAADQLRDYMKHLVKEMVAAAENYDSIKRGNSSFKLHLLGGWGGASDPGSQDHFKMSVIRVRDTMVFPMIERGEFLKAFNMIMAQKGVVERQAKEVADYDEDLDVGYKRLARSMQVLEVALTSLVPVAGEAALASGSGILAVGGTAVASGTGGAVIVEGAREIASGEGLSASKLASTGRQALSISAGALAGPATKALGGMLGAGQPGVAGMLAGETAKAGVTDLVAGTVASGTVAGTQSLMGGGSFGEGFVGGGVTHLGMAGVKGAGFTGPVGSTVGSAGAGALGAWASGGDWIGGLFGGVGTIGGLIPGLARPRAGGRPPAPGKDGVPVHVGSEGDANYRGPPAFSEADVMNDLSRLNHGWTNVNKEWFALEQVDWAELIAKYPEDRMVWDNLREVYGIVRDPQKLAKGMIKIFEGAAREGITPEQWLVNYFGGPDGMPRLLSTDPEAFRQGMLAEKPALDLTLKADYHGLLTHMFQEFVLAEEWGSRAKARDFRRAIAVVNGPRQGDKKMFSRVWDALFDSLEETGAINRPEFLGPILAKYLNLPAVLRGP